MRANYPYLEDHGEGRIYVRRHGRRVRIQELLTSPDFPRAYVEAMDALEHPKGAKHRSAFRAAPAGTLGWLAGQYFGSARFTKLDPRSQATRRDAIEGCLREPVKPSSRDTMASFPIARLTAAVVMMLMDRKAGKPGAANNRKKYLSAMFGWAVKHHHMKSNPARDAERERYASDGFHAWTIEEVHQFEVRHPIGTKARLALALLLFTGSRGGDMVTFGRQHVRDGVLRFVPHKTSYKRKVLSEKPVLAELAAVIAASPCGDLTFLVTDYGKPFTASGFRNWFRDRCNEAGLTHCTAHGLKKAGATLAAEAGATDRQMMALFDWTTASQANAYTAAANRRKLAGEAGRLLAGQFGKTAIAPYDDKLLKTK